MRSLTLKLTLAFLFVGLIGALLVAVFVGLRTQREFDQFISDRYQQDLVEQLADFYQQNGSWQGLSAINLRFDNDQGRAAYMRAPVALADNTQTVVLGTRRYRVGQQVSQAELRGSLPVTVDGQTVGSVLLDLPDASPSRDPYSPEDAFDPCQPGYHLRRAGRNGDCAGSGRPAGAGDLSASQGTDRCHPAGGWRRAGPPGAGAHQG